MFVPRLYTPGTPTWIFRSGLSLWQQSLTGMLIAYLSCAVSGSWASLSGLTLAAHKPFLTLILDDFEYDLAVGPRGDCAKHDAERLGRARLLAYHPA